MPWRAPSRTAAKRPASGWKRVAHSLGTMITRPFFVGDIHCHPSTLTDKVVTVAGDGSRAINFEQVAALPPAEKQALRGQVEQELTDYFVNLRDSLMLGLLTAPQSRVKVGGDTLRATCYHYLLEINGGIQYAANPPNQYPLPFLRSEITQYIRGRGSHPLLTVGEIKAYGWPKTLGVIFDPEKTSAEEDINRLLTELESDHRLVGFINFEHLRSSLRRIGVSEEALAATIESGTFMHFELARVRLPHEIIDGRQVRDVRLTLARAPFNPLRSGVTDGVTIDIFRSVLFLSAFAEITSYFNGEANTHLKKLLDWIIGKQPTAIASALQKLIDLDVEITKHHEEGHCVVEGKLGLSSPEQTWCASAMHPDFSALIEIMANIAPVNGKLSGVYARIYKLARSRNAKHKKKAKYLLQRRLAEVTLQDSMERLIEEPIIAAIFPNSASINLARFRRLWEIGLFEILGSIFMRAHESHAAAWEGKSEAPPILSAVEHEQRIAEATQTEGRDDFRKGIENLMRDEVIPAIIG